MLIKAYTGSVPGQIHLIENVRDVVVHMGSYTSTQNGPQFEGPEYPTMWREIELSSDVNITRYRFIDYTDHVGVRTRLRVGGYAYICNDDGKTVEKVIAGQHE